MMHWRPSRSWPALLPPRERTSEAYSADGRLELRNGSKVAIIGGGPAGAFFALHLLRQAAAAGLTLAVIIFERRRSTLPLGPFALPDQWRGCNYCAGGISPKLNDVLEAMDLRLPETIIQSRVHSVTIQGFWKNIEVEIPAGRSMLCVYRGSRPDRRQDYHHNFDAFLLDRAVKAGAGLITGEVLDVVRDNLDRPVLRYVVAERESRMDADLVVFAAGVNESVGAATRQSRALQALSRLIPGFVPPPVRHALIFELEVKPQVSASLADAIYFVEYGSRSLPLEMCSLVPKRGYLTVTLVGRSVDAADDSGATARLMKEFLELPHIRKLLSQEVHPLPACACRPNIVVGSAQSPVGHRVAAVGDIVTSRLYKDGILSAEQTARALAQTVVERGVDSRSLREGFAPTLARFRLNNRIAALVFLIHRLFFSSSVLSRVLYQAVISERKTTPARRRQLEKILWQIASGDDEYREIFREMVKPSTVWSVLTAGALTTLRNYLTELMFGLRWEGFGRFTTGVALERLEEKRRQFARLLTEAGTSLSGELEFERMYTIKIAASRSRILEELGRFGEPDRGYLRPRWVRIRRAAGEPNQPGCVITYEIGHKRFNFSLVLEQIMGGHLAIYRVRDGFARGGVLLFEIEELNPEVCALSIYVAFNFARGRSWLEGLFWRSFRLLFPAFVHDVVWNHSLCQLKDLVEAGRETRVP